MLYFGSKLHDTAVFSIRSAGRIGTAKLPIINPNNLHIDGFYTDAMNKKNNGVILDIDIRELTTKGLIINDHQDITEPDELIRLKPIIDLKFKLIGKPVYVNNKKIGKINDYAVDTKSLFITKLHIQPTLFNSFKHSHLIIDRKNVIEVTDKHIVVKGPEQKNKSKVNSKMANQSVLSSANASAISE